MKRITYAFLCIAIIMMCFSTISEDNSIYDFDLDSVITVVERRELSQAAVDIQIGRFSDKDLTTKAIIYGLYIIDACQHCAGVLDYETLNIALEEGNFTYALLKISDEKQLIFLNADVFLDVCLLDDKVEKISLIVNSLDNVLGSPISVDFVLSGNE